MKANIPVFQTKFGVTRHSGFWNIQNCTLYLSKLKLPRKLENYLSFEYTSQTQNSSHCRCFLLMIEMSNRNDRWMAPVPRSGPATLAAVEFEHEHEHEHEHEILSPTNATQRLKTPLF